MEHKEPQAINQTKYRRASLGDRLRTAKTHNMFVKKAGGIENHIHVLIEIPKTLSVSEAMKRLKGGSSNAIQQSGFFCLPER